MSSPLKVLREARSPFHSPWCRQLPPVGGAAGASPVGAEGRQLSRPAWRSLSGPAGREGASPVLCPGCAQERGQWPPLRAREDSCPAARLLAYQQNKPCSLWPTPRCSFLPLALLGCLSSSRWGGERHRSGDLSRARDRSLPQGIAHHVSQSPAVSRRVLQTRSVSCLLGPPALAGGERHTRLLPPLQPAARPHPAPYRSLLIVLPWLLARSLIRCRAASLLASPQVTPLSGGRLSQRSYVAFVPGAGGGRQGRPGGDPAAGPTSWARRAEASGSLPAPFALPPEAAAPGGSLARLLPGLGALGTAPPEKGGAGPGQVGAQGGV